MSLRATLNHLGPEPVIEPHFLPFGLKILRGSRVGGSGLIRHPDFFLVFPSCPSLSPLSLILVSWITPKSPASEFLSQAQLWGESEIQHYFKIVLSITTKIFQWVQKLLSKENLLSSFSYEKSKLKNKMY